MEDRWLSHPTCAAEARAASWPAPRSIRLDVAGLAFELDDLAIDPTDGFPVLIAPVGSPLCRAASEGAHAEFTVTSGLGRRGDPEREQGLTLEGMLVSRAVEVCDCCGERRAAIAVDLESVVLTRWNIGLAVPRERFLSRVHDLNRGYLQRTVEHANTSHEEELREAVARATRTPAADLLAASLDELTTTGVVLVWLDAAGAHRRHIAFRTTVTTAVELGEALRDELHAGIC